MGTLYIDRKDLNIKLDGRALALYEAGEKRGTVPLNSLERVVVKGNIALESRLLCALSSHSVDIVFMNGRGSQASTAAFAHSHLDARRRLAQYHLFYQRDRQFSMALELVQGKCKKQRQLLQSAVKQRADLRHSFLKADAFLAECENKLAALPVDHSNLQKLRGLEGSGAALYFAAYRNLFPKSLDFTRRKRRPPPDPVNVCLSLGYTLLHHEAVSACRQAGIDPMLGFYHEPAYGRESLACDLIEPLRPRLDELVWDLFREKCLRPEHFSNNQGACEMNKSGRKHFYARYEQFVTPLRRLLRLHVFQLAKFYLQQAPESC